jgi:uncharacterized protein DUF4434
VLATTTGDPDHTGVVLRESLKDSGINVVMLQDGVGTFDPLHPKRAARYYQGLRNALTDRLPRVLVWANLELFECETPDCKKTHPTTTKRFTDQLCGAAGRVDGIMVFEYFSDLAPQDAGPDATTDAADAADVDAQPPFDEADASAQLRSGFLALDDAGLHCQ